MLFENLPVVIKGGGDLATGAAYRLVRAGFPVLITELERPLAIRRTVAFASAVYEGHITVDGLMARRIDHSSKARGVWAADQIPVLVDPEGASLAALVPAVVIDARMAKHSLDTALHEAPLVIALGPGFEAGQNCHAVIETKRGHDLGRVLWRGCAEPDTGSPGEIGSHTAVRVLRAPSEGHVMPFAQIGDRLSEGQPVASTGGMAVIAPFDGVLRGLIHPSVYVLAGLKIGDIDPRGEERYCFTISDKALAIGGGALEAIFSAPQLAPLLNAR